MAQDLPEAPRRTRARSDSATASRAAAALLYAVREGVAVNDISGTIHRYGDPEWDAVGHDTIKAVSLAMRDRSASALPLLRFNSPGGLASGVPELAAWLATQTAKPVYAYADGLCARRLLPRGGHRARSMPRPRPIAAATSHLPAYGLVRFRKMRRPRHPPLPAAHGRPRQRRAEPLTDEVSSPAAAPIDELHTMLWADVAVRTC